MSAAFPVRILPLLLALAVAGSAHAFEYAGLNRTIDPTSLRALFPDSRHEFWERGTGSIAVPEDEDGRFLTLLKGGDGRYVVRLAPDDTRAEVTSVSLTLDGGEVVRLGLAFEREGQGVKPEAIERRFPGCRGVLDALIERYGAPVRFATRMEDNLEHRLRTWSSPEGIMRLDCGRFAGRRPIFAMDLEFEAGSVEPAPPAKPKAPVAAPVAAQPAPKPVAAPPNKAAPKK
jgi:hypothetical protein